jgi:hypothetical protein
MLLVLLFHALICFVCTLAKKRKPGFLSRFVQKQLKKNRRSYKVSQQEASLVGWFTLGRAKTPALVLS